MFHLGFLRKTLVSGAFYMSCKEPVKALIAFDASSIPASDDSLFLIYGETTISTAFNFYGKPAEDDYKGHKLYIPPS